MSASKKRLVTCDIVAVQESWEKEDSKIDVDDQRSQRGEGGG